MRCAPPALCLLLAALTPVQSGCRSAPSPGSGIVKVDEDGDGRTDLWRSADPGGPADVRAPVPGSDPPRTVVLAIDAIPYGLFADLQREGRFRAFFPASRLVAPFPSLTNLGFSAILRTPPPRGYEDLYFDTERDAFVGGAWDRLTGEYKEIAPFHEAFDWEEPRLWGAFVFYLPDRVREAELVRIEEILMGHARGMPDPVGEKDSELLLYLGSTDAIGHVGGREALREHLLRVDEILERFLAAGGGRDRVVLLSDHGTSDTPSRLFDLEAALGRAGFRVAATGKEPRDVVAPAYGLVGSIQLYTSSGQEEAVARAVVAQDGADFAVWLATPRPGVSDFAVRAVDAAGSPDPLDRPADAYPMLRERVRRAFDGATLNPADVLVSLEDGWHYGSPLFDRLVEIRGTHGSARASSSVGFLASNVDRTPAWIAAEDALPWLGLEERSSILREQDPHTVSNRISSSAPHASAHRPMRDTVGLASARSAWLTACWLIPSRPARSAWVSPDRSRASRSR